MGMFRRLMMMSGNSEVVYPNQITLTVNGVDTTYDILPTDTEIGAIISRCGVSIYDCSEIKVTGMQELTLTTQLIKKTTSTDSKGNVTTSYTNNETLVVLDFELANVKTVGSNVFGVKNNDTMNSETGMKALNYLFLSKTTTRCGDFFAPGLVSLATVPLKTIKKPRGCSGPNGKIAADCVTIYYD